MPSKTARKRYRRRLEAGRQKATATAPESWGTWGKNAQITRGDLRLAALAIRNEWPIGERVREEMLKAVLGILDRPELEPRMHIAAAWVIIEMVADNRRNGLRETNSAAPQHQPSRPPAGQP